MMKRSEDINNLLKVLRNREVKGSSKNHLKKKFHFNESLIKRLGLEKELEGHQGCVNCLQWSSDGRRLISGSDDTNINIWDPFRHKLLKTVPTPHIGNIFSVKLLGTDESLVATCAGDCRVIVQSIEHAMLRQTPHLDCGCHVGRVKRLAKAPEQPQLFWSAAEDGLSIQYDMRQPHECLHKCNVLIDVSYTSELKCISVNPTRPHYIAFGANDCFVRIYDRRMIKTTPFKPNQTYDLQKKDPPELNDPNCVQFFAPSHLSKEYSAAMSMGRSSGSSGDLGSNFSATFIDFNSAGTEMLVNMGGEQIYLFDLSNPKSPKEMKVPDYVPKNKKSHTSKSCCCKNGTSVKTKNVDKCNIRISKQPSCACDYINRAYIFFQRKWSGDVYCAARDYLYVIANWPDRKDGYLGLINCLISLKWLDEAFSWLKYIKNNKPDMMNLEEFKSLHAEVITLKNNFKKNDTDEDENDDVHGKEKEREFRENAWDFESRYLGHCNTTTDIKEATFLGEEGNYICAGSDDGIIFIWDKKTTNLVNALWGDVSIVNCVQPHPSTSLIASSGIDPVVKLWSPLGEDVVEMNPRRVKELWATVETNQQRMTRDPFETMLANLGYRLSPVEGHEIPTCRTT